MTTAATPPTHIRVGHLVEIRANTRSPFVQAVVVEVGRKPMPNGNIRSKLVQLGDRPTTWWAQFRGGEYRTTLLVRFVRDEAGSEATAQLRDIYLNEKAYQKEQRDARRAWVADRFRRLALEPGFRVWVRYRTGPLEATVLEVDPKQARVRVEDASAPDRWVSAQYLYTGDVDWEPYRPKEDGE